MLIHRRCSIKNNFTNHLKVILWLTDALGHDLNRDLSFLAFCFMAVVQLCKEMLSGLVPVICVFNSCVHVITYIITFTNDFLRDTLRYSHHGVLSWSKAQRSLFVCSSTIKQIDQQGPCSASRCHTGPLPMQHDRANSLGLTQICTQLHMYVFCHWWFSV